MRRIYHKVRSRTIETAISLEDYVVPLVGFFIFFFGFGAGAVLNLYLNAINHPLVAEFRSALTYKSAIIGDGVLLPIVGMVCASFLLKQSEYITKKVVRGALLGGAGITAWFHITQGVDKMVNWAMPTPWHWNFLGLWHAIYMFSIATLFSLFYLLVIRKLKDERLVGREAMIVTLGLVFFFTLLKLDYI